ncbi:MAG: LiaF-related protein [Bacteroidia bacterium]
MSNIRSMSFFSSAVFWGIVIILVGVSIILREVFHVHFPFLRVFFGILLIYWGVKMIAGGFIRNSGDNNVVFNESSIADDGSKREYNAVFGRTTVDLFKMQIPERDEKLEMNVVFGSGKVIINDSIPMRIKMTSVFGNIHSPDRNNSGFGSSYYTTAAYKTGSPCVNMEMNAVFGNIEVTSRKW